MISAQGILTEGFVRAFRLAFETHSGQVRKATRIPYIAHIMAVTAFVLEYGGDKNCAIAALLHDSVEDSQDGGAMERRIRAEFGDRVAGIVMSCSDAVAMPGRAKPEWRERKQRYLAKLEHEQDTDALLVSACDKLHNARSIVADLHEDGDSLWERFNAPKEDQLWYYQSLVKAYPSNLVPPGLMKELETTVREMHRD